jgi:hypothetical protein
VEAVEDTMEVSACLVALVEDLLMQMALHEQEVLEIHHQQVHHKVPTEEQQMHKAALEAAVVEQVEPMVIHLITITARAVEVELHPQTLEHNILAVAVAVALMDM